MRCYVKRHVLLAGVLGAVFLSPPAEANMILSVYHGAAWLMILALIPVIIVEVIVLALTPGISIGQAVLVGVLGNIASTLAGIPVNASLISGMRNSGPRWLRRIATSIMEYADGDLSEEVEVSYPPPAWIGIGSIVVLFVLFFLGSILIEALCVIQIQWFTHNFTPAIFSGVLRANLWSYGLIAALPFLMFAAVDLRERWVGWTQSRQRRRHGRLRQVSRRPVPTTEVANASEILQLEMPLPASAAVEPRASGPRSGQDQALDVAAE